MHVDASVSEWSLLDLLLLRFYRGISSLRWVTSTFSPSMISAQVTSISDLFAMLFSFWVIHISLLYLFSSNSFPAVRLKGHNQVVFFTQVPSMITP